MMSQGYGARIAVWRDVAVFSYGEFIEALFTEATRL